MKVAIIGMGKIGYSYGICLALRGHDVVGYDVNPDVLNYNPRPYKEFGLLGKGDLNDLIPLVTPEANSEGKLTFASSTQEAVEHGEIILITTQTPHDPEFEGITRLRGNSVDFDYSYLVQASEEVSKHVKEPKPVVIMSTILPGTVEAYIKPVINDNVKICYQPVFVAMTTTIKDFYDPEFVLLGVDDSWAADVVEDFYKETLGNSVPIERMSVASAELTKVAYNTYISSKIAIANTLMEICHKTDANIDQVTGALKKAYRRVTGPAYMDGGMGDGGGCLLPDGQVLTCNGFRSIKDIEVGDQVLTHTGELKKVLQTFKREYEGDIVRVKTKGMLGEWFTSDHPMLTAKDGRKVYSNNKRDTRNSITEMLESSEEVLASDLSTNHLIPMPVPKGNKFHPPVHATDEYVELAGWWLSEGSCELTTRRGRLCFSLHADESTTYGKHIERLLSVCAVPSETNRGNNATISNTVDGNSCSVRFGNLGLTQQLVNDFGKGAKTKTIPGWLLFGSYKHAQLVLKGIFLGDGHCEHNRVSLEVTSLDLALGVFTLLSRLGFAPTIKEKPAHGVHATAWAVRVGGEQEAQRLAELVGFDTSHMTSSERFSKFEVYGHKDDSVYRHVTGLEVEHYVGDVYNINVEDDHTYVTLIGAVQNCHPRDNIALSWLSDELGLSYDWFEAVMEARECQTEFLAELIIDECWNIVDSSEGRYFEATQVPITILGYSFKPETNIITGSPAILLFNILKEWRYSVTKWDPYVDESPLAFSNSAPPQVIFIGTKHFRLKNFVQAWIPRGSIIIDPFRFIPDHSDHKVIRIGE